MMATERKPVSRWHVILVSLFFAVLYSGIRGCEEYNLSQYGKYTNGQIVHIWQRGGHNEAVVLYEVGERAFFGHLDMSVDSGFSEGDSVVVRYYPKNPENAVCSLYPYPRK